MFWMFVEYIWVVFYDEAVIVEGFKILHKLVYVSFEAVVIAVVV